MINRTTGTAEDEGCDVQLYNTNYPEIKVIMDSEAPNIETVKTQITMDFELGMSDESLMYRTEQLLSTWTKQMPQHSYTLGINKIAHMEKSPLPP